jgi:acetate kinase
MRVLIVNAGSSSLKLRLLGPDDELLQSWEALPADLPAAEVVAHRVVHGGTAFRDAVVIDAAVESALRDLVPLAPLHQPKALQALDDVRRRLPRATQVACFDTAFHGTLGDVATTYALPQEWTTKYGLRRYGFHGLSHSWASKRAIAMAPGVRRVVTCQLGAGVSLCAVLDGSSVDTTMGFTPLEGLVMATRSGSVDPGLVLWLEEHERLSPGEIAVALEERSGLLALAGTADMREVEAGVVRQNPDALLALGVYLHRLAAEIAAMSSAMGGLDAVTFSGGVGERSPLIRARIAARLAFLGLALDPTTNEATGADTDLTAAGAPVSTLVIIAREDLQIAREVRDLLSSPASWSGPGV